MSARFLKQRSVSTRNAFDEQVILLSFEIELDFSHFLIGTGHYLTVAMAALPLRPP